MVMGRCIAEFTAQNGSHFEMQKTPFRQFLHDQKAIKGIFCISTFGQFCKPIPPVQYTRPWPDYTMKFGMQRRLSMRVAVGTSSLRRPLCLGTEHVAKPKNAKKAEGKAKAKVQVVVVRGQERSAAKSLFG